MNAAIVLFAHGARDPEWAQPFLKIQALVKQQFPTTPVTLAFLELMQPSLQDTVANLTQGGTRQITLIPLFLARGGHLKQDLPRLVENLKSQFPATEISIAPAIGEEPAILHHIAQWIVLQHAATQRNP